MHSPFLGFKELTLGFRLTQEALEGSTVHYLAASWHLKRSKLETSGFYYKYEFSYEYDFLDVGYEIFS